MTTLAMLRRSGGATLFQYGLRTLAALAAIAPLVPGLPDSGAGSPNEAALALAGLASCLSRAARLSPWPCALYVLLAPACTLAWCTAMHGTERARLIEHARRAYLPALGLALRAGVAAVVVLGLSGLMLERAPRLLPASVPLEDALFASGVLLCAAALFVIGTLYDLGCAALSDRATAASARAALRCARSRLSLSLLLRHAALVAAIALVLLFGELAARALTAPAPWLVLPVQQLAVFAAIFLRATWLAFAVEATTTRR